MTEIAELKQALNDSQAIIIGAGAGLSTSAGFIYNGERFSKYFSDFEAKYGFHDMYSGGFYPFESSQEFWAYWSRNIFINRYNDPPIPVYDNLLSLVQGKNYFVITTNVDHCFQKAGFDKSRLFYTQGDYGLFQCSLPCHNKTYDNEAIVMKMIETQRDMKVPEELLPVCPVCGRPMRMNLRSDDDFVEDEDWHRAADNYVKFLDANHDSKTLFLELGTGMNTPGIIKFPFWRMTSEWPDALYCCVNLGEAKLPNSAGGKLLDRAILINQDISEVLQKLL